MANIKVIQQSIDVIGRIDAPDLQVIQQSIDVIGHLNAPDLQVIQQSMDVIGHVDPPALNVSQLNLEVAGIQTGSARINRVYLEVLSPLHTYSLEDTLNLSHSAVLEELLAYATSTLTLTQSSTQSLIGSYSTDTLLVTQVATYRHIPGTSGTSTLVVTDTLEYIGPKYANANNILVLSGATRVPNETEVSTNSTLVFVQTVGIGGKLNYTANSSLYFIQYADTKYKTRNVADALSFTQLASADRIIFASSTLNLTQEGIQGTVSILVTSALALTQTAAGRLALLQESVTSTLVLDDAIALYPYYGRADDTLILTDTATIKYPQHVNASSNLITVTYEIIDDQIVTIYTGLSDTVTVGTDGSRVNRDYLQWYQEADVLVIRGAAKSESLTSTLILQQASRLSKSESISSTLTLTQTASGLVTQRANDTLVVTQTVSNNKEVHRTLESELTFVSSFTYEKTGVSTCPYNPTFGSGSPLPQRLVNVPTFTKQDHITLWYPFSSPTNTIELRTPELGNQNQLEFQRINRRTRGGTLIIWADDQWPKNEHITLSIRALSETKIQELMGFITISLGKEIGFTDWEENTWKAIILNPDSVFARNRLNDIQTPLELELTWSAFIGAGLQELTLIGSALCQKVSILSGSSTFIPWAFANISDSIKTLSGVSTLSWSDSARRIHDPALTSTLTFTSGSVGAI